MNHLFAEKKNSVVKSFKQRFVDTGIIFIKDDRAGKQRSRFPPLEHQMRRAGELVTIGETFVLLCAAWRSVALVPLSCGFTSPLLFYCSPQTALSHCSMCGVLRTSVAALPHDGGTVVHHNACTRRTGGSSMLASRCRR
jgi:hypothetical protein